MVDYKLNDILLCNCPEFISLESQLIKQTELVYDDAIQFSPQMSAYQCQYNDDKEKMKIREYDRSNRSIRSFKQKRNGNENENEIEIDNENRVYLISDDGLKIITMEYSPLLSWSRAQKHFLSSSSIKQTHSPSPSPSPSPSLLLLLFSLPFRALYCSSMR